MLEDTRYLNFYVYRREVHDDYLILDNSAHELGASQNHEILFENAHLLNAQEVVLPDVLFDRRGTVERTKRVLKWMTTIEGWAKYSDCGMPRMMMVPQGNDRAEWVMCLHQLLDLWDTYTNLMPSAIEAPVIGISKDYDSWRGGLLFLIGHYISQLRATRDFDLHCLGWPTNLWSLAHIQRNFPWVRSTDSAKPFVYAKAGILLEPGGLVPHYPRRDPEYFFEPFTEEQWAIAQRNCFVFESAASDDLVLM